MRQGLGTRARPGEVPDLSHLQGDSRGATPGKVVRRIAVLAGCLLLSACATPSAIDLSSGQSARSSSVTVDVSPCSRTYQTTVLADRLTVGVSAPLVEPYFIDGDPSSGEGFEAGLVYAIAAELGLPNTGVTWQTVPPEITPLDAEVDFVIDREVPGLREGISYSAPYVQQPQAAALAFAPGNPLIDCVNDALAALTERGELSQLTAQWLEPDVPPTAG